MNDVSLVVKLSCLTFYSNHMVTTGHKSKIYGKKIQAIVILPYVSVKVSEHLQWLLKVIIFKKL